MTKEVKQAVDELAMNIRVPSTPRRILIADRQEILRKGVRTLIGGRGDWQIIADTSDGEAAFEFALAYSADIVITDYALPGINGLELTHRLREHLPDIEILFYTLDERNYLMFQALRAGARGYLLKSEPEGHLVDAVEALAAHRPYLSPSVSQTMLDCWMSAQSGAQERNRLELSSRERQIVQMIAEGRQNKEIASLLSISSKTVETHRAICMRKLGISSTSDIVRYAIRSNLIQA
ncbi:DNA-binding response regulator [Sphingomonas sp. DBB INV C78]|uniref:response regulator n=1 Tax=Sphingomonas sp. DBB INV C78 TaxID=3349434 RepID=UPI0036D2ED49